MSHEEVYIANALAVWKSAYERTDKMFAALEEEELLKEVAPKRNRLIYLLGHLTAVHDRMIVMLGIGDRVKPEYDALFLTAPDLANPLPGAAELRETWKMVNDRLNAGLAGMPLGDWAQRHTAVTEDEFAKDPLRNKLAVLLSRTNHISYHLGQANLYKR